MPTLQLKISPKQTPQRCQSLAQALTELSTRHLGKRREVTALMIEELPASQWFIGASVALGPTACLEISITQGTNTAQEKAAFIAAAFAELQAQLGVDQPLASASYVIVREVPATDWGYGGQTQAARKLVTTSSL
jgi:4-oxalocrotonate tautomerase